MYFKEGRCERHVKVGDEWLSRLFGEERLLWEG